MRLDGLIDLYTRERLFTERERGAGGEIDTRIPRGHGTRGVQADDMVLKSFCAAPSGSLTYGHPAPSTPPATSTMTSIATADTNAHI